VAKRPAFLRGIILFIIGSSVSCGWAFSQASAPNGAHDLTNLSIEELGDVEVYSASKFNQRASEAPASISIITAGDIRRYGYRSFDEILSSVSGFYSTYDRNYAYLGARGFGLTGDYNSRILLLVDGHRLNDNVYYSSSIGRDFPLSLELIERIEIVRGPGSSLYGTNAFFAVVNVITRRGRAFNGTHVFLEAGSRQTYQGTATFGRFFNSGFEVLVSGSYLNSKGYRRLYFPEFDSPGNNDGIAQDADTEKTRIYSPIFPTAISMCNWPSNQGKSTFLPRPSAQHSMTGGRKPRILRPMWMSNLSAASAMTGTSLRERLWMPIHRMAVIPIAILMKEPNIWK
jgi:outer membrane receptor protein involved in Fe transport